MSKLRKFISYNFPWEVSQRCASTKQVNNSFFFFANPCFYLFIYLFYCSSTVVSIFNRPWRPSPPIPASHPRTYPLWLCPCVLHTCSLMDLPLFPLLSLSPVPSGYCQFVLYFNISGWCGHCGKQYGISSEN